MVKFTDTIRHFFFQAEDGIRDYKVTGVQTCALPISVNHIEATSDKLVARVLAEQRGGRIIGDVFGGTPGYLAQMRSEERRVGKEGGAHRRGSHLEKKGNNIAKNEEEVVNLTIGLEGS